VLPSVAAGAAGLVLTAFYQTAVIVGIAAVSPEFRTGALAVIVSNAFFSTIHLVSNTVIFAVLAPTVLPRVVGLSVRRSDGPTARP
jgi:predicted anti-sigma-YlaC factor YlaD